MYVRIALLIKMRSWLFWDLMQHWLVVNHRHFGTTYRSHLEEF